MKLTENMTGMKIDGNRYYVLIEGEDKVVDGEAFADGRGVVVEKKVVSGWLWQEVPRDDLVAIAKQAKALGIVCEPYSPIPDVEGRNFDWSLAKTQAELAEENAHLKAENNALIHENVELTTTMVHPGEHMQELDELRTYFAKQLKEQAEQYATEIAELKQKIQYAENLKHVPVSSEVPF